MRTYAAPAKRAARRPAVSANAAASSAKLDKRGYEDLNIYLCSGLSSKFKTEDTIHIDVDRSVKPDIVADVRHLPLRPDLRPKTMLMTPPCTFFTYAMPYPRPGIGQAFEILGACFEAVNYLKPEQWILENPKNHLQRIIGKPKFGIRWKAFDTKATHLFYSNMKSLKRAKFPKEVCEFILQNNT